MDRWQKPDIQQLSPIAGWSEAEYSSICELYFNHLFSAGKLLNQEEELKDWGYNSLSRGLAKQTQIPGFHLQHHINQAAWHRPACNPSTWQVEAGGSEVQLPSST